MTQESDNAVIKKAILLTLEEKREVKAKELDALEKDAQVRKYLDLKSGVTTLDRAIEMTKLEQARAQVGAQIHVATPTHRPSKGTTRDAALALSRLGGSLIAALPRGEGRGTAHIYHVPYSHMLAEFRGQKNVLNAKVYRYMKKEYGLSRTQTRWYLIYARTNGTAVPNQTVETTKGQNVMSYDFPSRYDGVMVIEEQEARADPDEVRRANPIR